MIKLKNLGRSLGKAEHKKIIGGDYGNGDWCNAFSGTGSNATCQGDCNKWDDAGNARNLNKPGGDKICVQILFIFVFNLFFHSISAQSNSLKYKFVLNGTITGRDTGKIVLWYPDSMAQWRKDTAAIKKGKFKFQGFVKEPSFVHLIGPKKERNYNNFFLQPGNQHIILEENDFEKFKMSGSVYQKQDDSLTVIYKGVKEKYKTWIDEYERLQEQLNDADDSATIAELKKKLSLVSQRNQVIDSQLFNKTLLFISQHPDSYVSATELYGFVVNRQIQNDLGKRLYNRFTERIKNSRLGILTRDEFDKRKIGTKAPDFSAKDVNGKDVILSSFKDKYVLLDFWASWCVPCVKQFPELQELYQNYNDKGFEILAISIDAEEKKWVDAIKKYNVSNFYHVLANPDISSKYSNTAQPIPSQILINQTGTVIWNSMSQTSELKRFCKRSLVTKNIGL